MFHYFPSTDIKPSCSDGLIILYCRLLLVNAIASVSSRCEYELRIQFLSLIDNISSNAQ